MVVSFIGSLPLGTLNIAAMQISVSDGVMAAMLFSFGSLLVEIIYVRTSLAFYSFYAAMHPKVEKNFVLDSPLPKFLLGMVMCAVNPVQIPFWFGWSTVLFTKKVLLPRNDHYNSYIIGIGIGTFIGNCVFIFGGLLIAARINNNQHILNWVVGGTRAQFIN